MPKGRLRFGCCCCCCCVVGVDNDDDVVVVVVVIVAVAIVVPADGAGVFVAVEDVRELLLLLLLTKLLLLLFPLGDEIVILPLLLALDDVSRFGLAVDNPETPPDLLTPCAAKSGLAAFFMFVILFGSSASEGSCTRNPQ